MDWLNLVSDITMFCTKHIFFWWGVACISEYILIMFDYFTSKPLIIPSKTDWNTYMNTLPFIIDTDGKKFFYIKLNEWYFCGEDDKRIIYTRIMKDLSMRIYLLENGYDSPYREAILEAFNNYQESIENFKKLYGSF